MPIRLLHTPGTLLRSVSRLKRPRLDAHPSPPRSQGHLASYNEDMPVEQLVQKVCDLKQGYTQFGGEPSLASSRSAELIPKLNRSATIRSVVPVRRS